MDTHVKRVNRLGNDKHDGRRLGEILLDKEVEQAPKLGQTVPVHDWFRESLDAPVMSGLSPGRVARSGISGPAAVQPLIDGHMQHDGRHAVRLCPLITAIRWQAPAASGQLNWRGTADKPGAHGGGKISSTG